MMRANLWLRTASRVLVRVARFRATEFHELERRARRVEWSAYLGRARAAFRVTTHKSRLYHSDAIAERLTAAAARGAPAGAATPDAPEQLFVVRVVRDEFEISVDASGELLHRRGYRLETARAPLRETLAAALLLGAGWPGDMALLDPFCGAGTIPIEAALIACRIAPGHGRRFAFMEWPSHQDAAWRDLLDDARSMQRAAPAPLAGSDRDAGAIAAARANADRAGVAEVVTFTAGAVSAARPPAGTGLVATNPPYGVRVGGGGTKDVRNLYARFGTVLRAHFDGWRLAAYVPAPALARQLGLPLRELFRTTNGGLRVAALAADVASSAGGG